MLLAQCVASRPLVLLILSAPTTDDQHNWSGAPLFLTLLSARAHAATHRLIEADSDCLLPVAGRSEEPLPTHVARKSHRSSPQWALIIPNSWFQHHNLMALHRDVIAIFVFVW